jgi:hypothetical protein
MIDNTSKILLTVSRGKSLTKVGAYKEADVTVKNPFTTKSGRWRQLNSSHFRSEDGEEVIIHKPIQTIHQPEYKESTQVVNLGYHFIQNALTRPSRPRKGFYHWIKTPIGKLFQDWKHKSDEQKLQVHLEELAQSLGGTVKSWELL